VHDITSKKKLESQMKTGLKEKEMVLKDVQQRVKSNLKLIYSLLSLQTEYIKDRQALSLVKESRERIRSIALMHEKLAAYKDTAVIDFASYVHNLTARLMRSYEIDRDRIILRINTDQTFLDVKTAIPCGLIISELISNSLKYAFPEGKKGKITLIFRKEGRNRHALIVSDNGKGFPKDLDYQNPESLGMQIINDLVTQLQGTIRLDRRGGTTFTVSF